MDKQKTVGSQADSYSCIVLLIVLHRNISGESHELEIFVASDNRRNACRVE